MTSGGTSNSKDLEVDVNFWLLLLGRKLWDVNKLMEHLAPQRLFPS